MPHPIPLLDEHRNGPCIVLFSAPSTSLWEQEMGHYKPHIPLMPKSMFRDFLPVRSTSALNPSLSLHPPCVEPTATPVLACAFSQPSKALSAHIPLGSIWCLSDPNSFSKVPVPQQDMLEQHQLLLPLNLLPTLHLPGLLQGERNSFPTTLSSSSMAHWCTCQLWAQPSGLLNQLMGTSALEGSYLIPKKVMSDLNVELA